MKIIISGVFYILKKKDFLIFFYPLFLVFFTNSGLHMCQIKNGKVRKKRKFYINNNNNELVKGNLAILKVNK